MYPTPSSSGSRKRKLSYDRGSYKPRKVFSASKKRVKVRKGKYSGAKKKKSLSGLPMRKKKVSKMERYGVHLDYENYDSLVSGGADGQNLVIGHTTHSQDKGLFALGFALAKCLATKMGTTVSSFSQIIEGYNTADSVNMRIQANTAAAVTLVTMASPGASMSWEQVANWIAFTLKANVKAELIDLIYVPASNAINRYTVVNLQCSIVEFYSKSFLKLQNVSVPNDALDDTSDEVDAVALVGKTYVGQGLGTALIRPGSTFNSDIGLWANQNGLILRDTASATDQIYEIPRAEELINCKKSGKIVFPPGSIQSSQLNLKFKGYVNTFFRILSEDNQDGTLNPRRFSFGKFAIHSLEKAIETIGASVISVNYQFDNNIDCAVYAKNPTVTTQTVVVNSNTLAPIP